MITFEQQKKIEKFYKRALDKIYNGDEDSALKIVLEEMPIELYDKSLDMLDNPQDNGTDEELLEILQEVNDIVSRDSRDTVELNDEFIEDSF